MTHTPGPIQYRDLEGRDTTLYQLVVTEPAWAASRIEHMRKQLDEAREHRRRLFEALEGRLEDAPEWTPQFARELLDDLRPHVKKEGSS